MGDLIRTGSTFRAKVYKILLYIDNMYHALKQKVARFLKGLLGWQNHLQQGSKSKCSQKGIY